MKNKILIIIASILVAFVITACLTNPTKKDFSKWVGDYVSKSVDNDFLSGITGTVADKAANYSTKRKNFYLFSTYEMGNYKFVGVFKIFIPLSL